MMRLSPRRSLRAFTLVAAFALCGSEFFRPSLAQSPPSGGGFIELATSTDVRPVLSSGELATLLPARGAFTFPLPYGTTGVRLTNADDCSGFADCVAPVGPSTWSKISNSAGSSDLYVVLGLDYGNGGEGPTLFRYNKTTGATSNLGPLFDAGDDLRWSDTTGWYFSGTQPTTLYIAIDHELRRYDVLTHTSSVVVDITAQFGEDKEIWDAHSSRDDRMHSFTVRSATNYEPFGCAVYREDTQQFSYFPVAGTYEGCQVDKSGHWLLIKQDEDSGVDGVDNRIINLDLGTSTVLLDAQGAAGSVDLGFGTMIAADDHNAAPNAIRRWSFGPLTAGPVVYRDLPGAPSTFQSISFANARSASLDEQFACGSAANRTNGPRANEIVCAKLDGSLNTLVVAPVMTDLDAAGGGSDDAAKAPNGALDPTGEYFLWTSNAMGDRLDAFLVRVPSSLLVTPPGDTTPPAVAITQPSPSATVSGSANLSATASDDIGVAGVQFQLDGVNLGTEITAPPYAWTWNTTTTTDGAHTLMAVARDAAGNTAWAVPIAVTVLNTPAAPVISGVTASSITDVLALISWSTNQLTDAQVEYGLTTNYGLTTTLDTRLATSHMQLLSGLNPATTYHYRVVSYNAQNTIATSIDSAFTTTAPPLISGVGTSVLNDVWAHVSWTTDSPSSSQVEYGLTTDYGDATEFNRSLVTEHGQTITGLVSGTTYHYRVYSVNGAGVPSVSGDFTFTTATYPPTLSPGSGTFHTEQTVTVYDSDTTAVMHYTLNGADPTEQDPIINAGASLTISVNTTLKVRAWTAGGVVSPVAIGAYEFKPMAPTFSPPAGTYASAPSVAIRTSTTGATLTYTTDGSDPTSSSTSYASPLSVSTNQTLKSRAFKTGWTASDLASAAYTIDPNAPTIWWVSPTRAGVGAHLTITGARFGAQQNNSTVTIDGTAVTVDTWSAGSIALTVPYLPSSGPVVVTVNGIASNGVPFDFVLGMRRTRQTTYISPDEIRIAVGESRRLKLVDQQGQEVTGATWTVSDSTRAEITDSSDGSPDPAPGDPPRPFMVVGLAAGHTTITAVSALGTAQADVTIYDTGGASGATGTNTGWHVYSDTIFGGFTETVKGQPNDPSDPDYYLAETVDVGGYAIRALDDEGRQLWRKFFPQDQYVSSLVALADGGLLTRAGDNLVKIAPDGDTLWSQAAPDFQMSAVGFDGTIYGWSGTSAVVRDGETGSVRYSVQNAVPAGTFTIRYNPLSSHPLRDPDGCAPYNSETPPAPYSLSSSPVGGFVGANGHYYFAYQKQTAVFISDTRCFNVFNIPMIGKYSVDTDVSVVELLPDAPGATVVASHESQTYGANSILHSEQPPVAGPGWESGDAAKCSWGFFSPCLLTIFDSTRPDVIPSVQIERLAPDGAGGVLVTRLVQPTSGFGVERLVRVLGGAPQYDVPMPGNAGGSADVAVGDDGMVLFSRGSIAAIDPSTGALVWEHTDASGWTSLLSTTTDGGAIKMTLDPDTASFTSFQRVDADGVAVGSPASVPGDLTYLDVKYVSDGMILVLDPLDSSVDAISVAPLTTGPGTTLSNAFGGIFKMFAIHGRITREHLETGDTAGATGYDHKYPAVMVPADGLGLNRVEIHVGEGQTVTLTSANVGLVTVDKTTITGAPRIPHSPTPYEVITLTAGPNAKTCAYVDPHFNCTTQIRFTGADGKPVGKPLQVDVKPLRTVEVRYFRILDNAIVPDKIDQVKLQTQLDQIFLRQANIKFTVVNGGDYAFHYDTQPADQKMAFTEHYGDNPELNSLQSAFFPAHQRGFACLIQSPSCPSDLMNVFYVKEIAKPGVGGFAQGKFPYSPAVVRSTWLPTPSGYVENLTVHEIGHMLGRGGIFKITDKNGNKKDVKPESHNDRGSQFLMFESNLGSVKRPLSRIDWNIMNFHDGSPIK